MEVPISEKEALIISEGMTSSEEAVVFILLTKSQSSLKETFWKQEKEAGLASKNSDGSDNCKVKEEWIANTLSEKNF